MEPSVVIMNRGGGTEKYERVPDDPDNHWQQFQELQRLPIGEPITAAEVVAKVSAIVLDQ